MDTLNTPVPGAAPAPQASTETPDLGDVFNDVLFPPGDSEPTTAPAAAPAPQAPSPQPAPQPQDDFFLQTQTGTVYKTRDDAVRGLEHKDQLIEQLRQKFAESLGVDPLTGKPVAQPQAQPQSPIQPQSYLEGDQYLKDLTSAVNSGDPKSYTQVQARFAAEIANRVIAEQLGPLGPLIQRFAQSNALEQVSSEIQDFRKFQSTSEYKQTLTEFPDLKEAIQVAENDPRFADRLPKLYKLAYRAAYGVKAPELVQQAQAAAPQPKPVVRPTIASQTLAPSPNLGVRAGMGSSEGRKALIAELEAKGIGDLPI